MSEPPLEGLPVMLILTYLYVPLLLLNAEPGNVFPEPPGFDTVVFVHQV